AAGRGAFPRPACAYYIAAPSVLAPTSRPQTGVAPAWPNSVRSAASCRPPPLLSRPATSCSRTSSAVASWKRPPSIRRNGSTTRCCIWPTGTPSWTSRGSRSCASWASATAGPWWDGARRSAPTPERHTARRSGRSGNGRPVSLPRGPQPPPAAPRGTPTSPPENQRRATTTIAPAPTSVAVRRWPGAGRTPAAPPARASTHATVLSKRDVVGDADIGRERGHHRAVFLERELDRPTRFRLVRAVPSDGEPEVQRDVASRLHLAARASDRDLE